MNNIHKVCWSIGLALGASALVFSQIASAAEVEVNCSQSRLEQLTRNGDRFSAWKLAEGYEKGRFESGINLQLAERYYALVLTNASDEVYATIAECYSTGRGTNKNLFRAIQSYRRAIFEVSLTIFTDVIKTQGGVTEYSDKARESLILYKSKVKDLIDRTGGRFDDIYYIVQPNDDVGGISKEVNLPATKIYELNPTLHKTGLRPGMILRARCVGDSKISNVESIYNGPTIRYVVKMGDTFSAISHARGMPMRVLKQINCMTNDLIRIGDVLLIPDAKVYFVDEEEDITSISVRTGVLTSDIVNMNPQLKDWNGYVKIGTPVFLPKDVDNSVLKKAVPKKTADVSDSYLKTIERIGNNELAHGLLVNLLAKHPDDVRILKILGNGCMAKRWEKPVDAVRYIQRAVDAGDSAAYLLLAQIYFTPPPEMEMKPDLAKGKALLLKAIILVDDDEKWRAEMLLAYNVIGEHMRDGLHKEAQKAFMKLKQIAEAGHRESYGLVAYCYKNGVGTEKDDLQARVWSEKSQSADESAVMTAEGQSERMLLQDSAQHRKNGLQRK